MKLLNLIRGITIPNHGGSYVYISMEYVVIVEIIGNIMHEYIKAPALLQTALQSIR
jgi:hypothetical protein